jgi:hypothetical protein
VRCNPSGLSAAETTMLVSRTNRRGSIGLRCWFLFPRLALWGFRFFGTRSLNDAVNLR